MNDPKISELTVSQLQKLIRETVQEAVAEVIIEFSLAAELQEQLEQEAEIADFLRSTIHTRMHDMAVHSVSDLPKLDD